LSNRFLFVKHGCRHCLEYERVVYRINLYLPLSKQIIVRDNFEFEKFKVKSNITQDRFSIEDFDGYPFFYIDGHIYKSGTNAETFMVYLYTLLKEDLLMDFNLINSSIEL